MPVSHPIFFWTYVALGPSAWGVVAYLVKVGRGRMSKLIRSRDALPATPPLVTILIPAKDEGVRIRDCLTDVLRQDYPAFEVIAINDRSSDDTGAILETFAREADAHFVRGSTDNNDDVSARSAANAVSAPPVRIVHVDTLLAGWLGKCHALDRGAQHARGDWLFFVDSDVRLSPDALTRMAALAIARDYDALSILTTIETHTFVERLMLPLLAGTWMTMFAGDQTNEDSEPDKALANGQAFLIRRTAYEKVGGHAAVKDRIVEDVELMRLLKSQGAKTRFMAGPHLAATRMHTNLPQMFNGWARIFAGTARGRIWPMAQMLLFLIFCGYSLLAAAAYAVAAHSAGWAAAAALHLVLILGVNYFVWTWSGNSPAYTLLLPLSGSIEIAILVYAIRKAFSGKIDWRGSAVDLRQTSRVIEKPPV